MSMTRQEHLDAVVRNYGEWHSSSHLLAFWNHFIVDYVLPDEAKIGKFRTEFYCFTREEVEARKAELQNKPSWDDAPEWAENLVQTNSGYWFWCAGDQKPSERGGWISENPRGKECGDGEVIGDWRKTLEKRPELQSDTATPTDEGAIEITDSAHDKLLREGHDIEPICEPSDFEDEAFAELEQKLESQKTMAERYPAYFKDVSSLQELDVYAVHKLFGIEDQSGAIQHASKKLLLSGVRTGGKSKYQDVKEARDTLNRWLELNRDE